MQGDPLEDLADGAVSGYRKILIEQLGKARLLIIDDLGVDAAGVTEACLGFKPLAGFQVTVFGRISSDR